MATRFSTEAANADSMGDETQVNNAPEGMPREVGADGTPRDRADRGTQRGSTRGAAKADEDKSADSRGGEAKPGKDINAAGFVKDKDAGQP